MSLNSHCFMKKEYFTPCTIVIRIHGSELLQQASVVVGGEKVNNVSDIGFVKGQRHEDHNVWDDDWSK